MFLLPVIATVGIGFASFSKSRGQATITLTDITIAGYLFYSTFNLFFIRTTSPDILMLYAWGMLLCLYIAFRNITDKTLIVKLIIGLGIFQSLIGIVQFLGWTPPYYFALPATGTFPTSGLYGGCLAISLTAGIRFLHATKQKILLGGSLLFIVVALIISNSRAAWFAAFCGIAMQLQPFITKRRIKIILLIVTCLFIVVLYFYRPDSANARLLIWQVCTQLIKQAPIVGWGIDTLAQYYMNAQAAYFSLHPDSKLIYVANNNYQAFNELIHITVEQGIIGLLVLIVLISSCRKSPYYSILFCWFTFALFSYPADDTLLMILLVTGITLCATSARKIYHFQWNKKWLLCSLLLIPFAVKNEMAYQKALQNIDTATVAAFPQNREYMLRFAKHKQEIATLKQLTQNIYSSTEILCDLGDAYQKKHLFKQADSCYSLAHRMVPCRIVPLHKLFLLYKDREPSKAYSYAQDILNHKSSAVGSAVLRARTDAKKFLNHE